eukprot:TRINITY_DN12544_c0_g1_i1.p1 TRINITY_DN12544_c0_g1~~TRINITY_DN12544_c0_g1_i1.p1  ORF type:complete len:411 (+),score=43.03 TRINITY_DN12544_c0_g1_i1:55-1287(+)
MAVPVANIIRVLKSVVSWCLVLFCTAYIIDGQVKGVSRSRDSLRGGGVVILVVLTFWLALLEGSQVGIVMSGALDSEQLEKFFMGRQLLVLVCVFGIAFVTVLSDPIDGNDPLSVNVSVVRWLGQAGFISSIVITIFGQQVSQTIASRSPSSFSGSKIVTYTVLKPSLFIVNTGILHGVLLLKILVTNTDPFAHKKGAVKILQYVAGFVSVVLWGVSSVYVVAANIEGKSNSLTSSAAANVVLLLSLWLILCYVEGLQVSLTIPGNKASHCQDPVSLKNFLIGRQVLVALIMFILSGITSVDQDSPSTVLKLSSAVQLIFLETGVCGALFLVVGQLLSRVLAAHSPGLLLKPKALPLVAVSISNGISASGLCIAAEDAASFLCCLFKIKPDDDTSNESTRTPSSTEATAL